jgi:hypothetical protein
MFQDPNPKFQIPRPKGKYSDFSISEILNDPNLMIQGPRFKTQGNIKNYE